jgi:hypothetical protein
MVSLSDLPTELLLIIFSGLRFQTNPPSEYWRDRNLLAILPLAGTNRLLWKVARTFLYHDLELFFHPPRKGSDDLENTNSWRLNLVTSLLCRTLREDPFLMSSVQSLNIRGFLAVDYGQVLELSDRSSFRQEDSTVYYSADDIVSLLVLCTNTRSLQIHGVLKESLQHETNQIIMSCLTRMTMLEELVISAGADIATGGDFTEGADLTQGPVTPDTIHSILAAASNKLKTLVLAPRHEIPSRTYTDFSTYDGPIADDKFQLDSLDLPTTILPLAAFTPWTKNLRSLTLNELKLSQGRTNQGLSIRELVMPMAATLRHLDLIISPFFSRPSLADFDMSQMITLESLAYEGPWWISPTVDPKALCQSLFSKAYKRIEFNIDSAKPSHRISHRSILALKEAFELAYLEYRAPLEFDFTVDISSSEMYDYKKSVELAAAINSLMVGLKEYRVKVEWEIEDQEDAHWQ